MAKVRSGALNVFRKNSLKEQQADVLKAMKKADVLSLSEVHGNELLRWAEAQGFGVIRSNGDTAILYDASKFDVEDQGSETINRTEGSTGGMRSREAAWAILRDKGTGATFSQIAAHTTPPNQGRKKRREKIRAEQYDGLSNLAKRLEREGGGDVFVAGDLNFRSPNIKGLSNATSGGIMHTLSRGAGAVRTKRMTGLNSDHAAVVTTFDTNLQQGDSVVDRKGGVRSHERPGTTRNGGRADDNKNGVDGISRKEMAAQYGFALAFMKQDPEIEKLFGKAVRQTWTADKFIANLRGTDWFKSHSAAVRNAILQQSADPATWDANVEKMAATVNDTWGKTFGEAAMKPRQIRQWAQTAQMMGWSEAELIDHMTRSIDYQKMLGKNTLGGTAAQVETQLDSLISNYGLDLGDKWKAKQLEKVIEGNDTIEGVANRVRELAKREYKAFAEAIDGGQTVSEIADPYIQKMATLLEMNPNDIDPRKNKMIQRALKATTTDGRPAGMDFAAFEDEVRRDQRWQYTDNAKKQVANVTEGLLRQFGVIS